MFQPKHDSDNQVLERPFRRREQPHAAAARWRGEGRFAHTDRSTFAVVTSGLSKIFLSLALLTLVGTGCLFAIQELDLTAQTDTTTPAISQAPIATNGFDQTAEITALRTDVALFTEQGMEMRSELAVLTGQGGVLPQLIARLQEQRRVNAAHANALRELYSTTGLISASLPSVENNAATSEPVGTRPVQVTPVAVAQEDAPKRVVLIPQGETDTQGTPGDEADE